MNKPLCQFYEKVKDKHKLDPDEFKTLLNIVRKEFSFLIEKNIPPIPENYEKWFYVFCHIIENKKDANDYEIIGLYKEFFDDSRIEEEGEEDEKRINITKKFKDVAEKIDNALKEVITNIDKYDRSLQGHTDKIEKATEDASAETMAQVVKEILNELKALRNENSRLKNELEKYHSEVVSLKEELSDVKREASIDFLTGLINRRRFERVLEEAIKDKKLRNYPSSLIFIDVDNFKQINDKYGHIAGDMVLKELAKIFRLYLRANSVIGRLGGEEFAILLPGTDIKGAYAVAERLRKIIETREVKIKTKNNEEKKIHITASFGITEIKKDDTKETVLNRADKAMYKAKANGKNRVESIL